MRHSQCGFVVVLSFLFLAGGLSDSGRAAFFYSHQGTGEPFFSHASTYGGDFVVGSKAISVTALGAYDHLQDGLATAKPVGLWSSAGMLLGTATVPSGTDSQLIGWHRYASLDSPVILSANTTYYIGAYYDMVSDPAILRGSVTLNEAISSQNLDEWARDSPALSMPTVTFGSALYNANMQFNVVPEPTGQVFVVSAILSGFAYRRRCVIARRAKACYEG